MYAKVLIQNQPSITLELDDLLSGLKSHEFQLLLEYFWIHQWCVTSANIKYFLKNILPSYSNNLNAK